jgi:aminoglycoside 3-N-acetyltransferase
MLTQETISNDLRRLGVQTGDAIVMHSSLRSLGKVEGGANAVIGALLDVIGPEGLLAAPAYTYSNGYFDPATDSCKTGAIPDAMWKWPGAARSWHPTHSVTAIGHGAADVCADHHLRGAAGLDSPFDRMAARGGKILLLGVGHNANSTIHVGESHAGVPFLHVPFTPNPFKTATVITADGPLEVEMKQPSGCSKAFGAVERTLRERGQVRDGMVGLSLVQWMSAQDVINATVDILTADPGFLLCTDPACYRCTESRKVIDQFQGTSA